MLVSGVSGEAPLYILLCRYWAIHTIILLSVSFSFFFVNLEPSTIEGPIELEALSADLHYFLTKTENKKSKKPCRWKQYCFWSGILFCVFLVFASEISIKNMKIPSKRKMQFVLKKKCHVYKERYWQLWLP